MLLRLIGWLFTAAVLAHGSDENPRLDAALKALESNDEIDQYRGYNECKTLYLRANLEKDSALSRRSLECLVNGGKKLGIDVARYEETLKKSGEVSGVAPSNAGAEASKSVAEPAIASSSPAPLKSAPVLIQKVAPPEAVRVLKNEPLRKNEEIGMERRHKLVEAGWKDAGLELTFDTPVQSGEIRMSKILEPDKERYRYIVDIESGLFFKSQTLEHKSINRIQMSQFNAKTLRLVFEHNRPISVKPSVRGNGVYIDLNLEPPKPTPPLATPQHEPVVQEPPLVAALPPLVNVTPRDRSKKVIVIDPGHGGKDSGAAGNSRLEKDIVLQIASKLSDRLKAMGYTVFMTRSNDTFIELKDRTKYANDKEADLFISVHANSIPKTTDPGSAQGIETYFLSPTRSERAMRVAAVENSENMSEMGQYGKLSFLSFLNTEKIIASNKLGIDLQKGMIGNLKKQFPNVRDNGVREAPFWVLVGAQMPAVLVEVGYISHPDESARIADDRYQKWMVEGLVEGVSRYFTNNG